MEAMPHQLATAGGHDDAQRRRRATRGQRRRSRRVALRLNDGAAGAAQRRRGQRRRRRRRRHGAIGGALVFVVADCSWSVRGVRGAGFGWVARIVVGFGVRLVCGSFGRFGRLGGSVGWLVGWFGTRGGRV